MVDSDGEEADGGPSLDCFNCRHRSYLPLPLPSTVLCDNCGLPLSVAAESSQQSEAGSGSGSDGDQLHLLLEPCGVCGEALSSGPLCFLHCGHLIHDQHRLVYRHCPSCRPTVAAYSAVARLHRPTAEEAEHYRRRKEAERERYGEEKGPCFPLFLQPSEVAHFLVYGDEETAEPGREAMERAMADVQREVREKQSQLQRQTAAEADRRLRVQRRRETLASRQDSLARRRDRTASKKRKVDELLMEVYALGRECSKVEKDVSHISQQLNDDSSQQPTDRDRDRKAMRTEDEAAFGSRLTDCSEEDSGQAREVEAETISRARPPQLHDEDARQSQLQALHTRYTHLHNSRIRQTARYEREQAALGKQLSAREAAVDAMTAECSEWTYRLATLRCEVTALELQRARRKRADTTSAAHRAGQQHSAAAAVTGQQHFSGKKNEETADGEALTSASWTVAIRSASGASTRHRQRQPMSALSLSRRAVQPSTAKLTSASSKAPRAALPSATTVRSSAQPATSASFPSFISSSSSSPSSSRRFPSFSPFHSVVGRQLSSADGRGGRVLLTAGGGAVQASASLDSSRAHVALHGRRAAVEASRGALDRFVQAAQR